MNRENLFLRVGTTRRIRTKRYNDSKAVRRVCSRDRLTLVRGEKQRFSTVILRLEREKGRDEMDSRLIIRIRFNEIYLFN